MLSVKQVGIKYSFLVFGITRPRIEPLSPGPLVNTLPIRPMLKIMEKDLKLFIQLFFLVNKHDVATVVVASLRTVRFSAYLNYLQPLLRHLICQKEKLNKMLNTKSLSVIFHKSYWEENLLLNDIHSYIHTCIYIYRERQRQRQRERDVSVKKPNCFKNKSIVINNFYLYNPLSF